MLEVLRHSEEVCSKVVVKQEVVNFLSDLCGGVGGVVDKPGAIAHFCIEELACQKGFIRLNEVEDLVRHIV